MRIRVFVYAYQSVGCMYARNLFMHTRSLFVLHSCLPFACVLHLMPNITPPLLSLLIHSLCRIQAPSLLITFAPFFMLTDLCYLFLLNLIFKDLHWLLPSFISWGVNTSVWNRLKGKHVVVTGATGELGKELCKVLAEKKVKLILVDSSEYKLVALRDKLKNGFKFVNASNCHIHPVDFSMENDFTFLDEYEDIGLLINNPDSSKPEFLKPALYLEEDDENLISVNIRSTTRITRRVLQKMIERKCGYILNVGSYVSGMPYPYLASYAASKAFLKIWSYSLHYEMKRFNIKVEYVEGDGSSSFARGILSSFGSTKHLVTNFKNMWIKIFLGFMPSFLFGRINEYIHRKCYLEKRLEERNRRKIEALKKGK